MNERDTVDTFYLGNLARGSNEQTPENTPDATEATLRYPRASVEEAHSGWTIRFSFLNEIKSAIADEHTVHEEDIEAVLLAAEAKLNG